MSKKYADIIGREFTVIMDRPIGTRHPKHDNIVYPINYGYIDGIMGGDGEEQDCYLLGVDEPLDSCKVRIIAVIHRLNDVEDKWVAVPFDANTDIVEFTEEKIKGQTHFQEQFYKIEIYI